MSQNKKFYHTDEFLKLNELWQKKLKDSSFEDLEEGQHEHWPLVTDLALRKTQRTINRHTSGEYYDIVNDRLNTIPFTEPSWEQTLQLYSQGHSPRVIAQMLGLSLYCIQYRIGKMMKNKHPGQVYRKKKVKDGK